MLTKKQHELLMFIHERIKETGVSPSFDEMKEALDLASKSGIHRLITALEERGFIRRLAHRARALEVMKLPEQATAGAPRGRAGFTPAVIEGGGRSQPAEPANDTRELVLVGKIAAGAPSPRSRATTVAIRCRRPCWARASTTCSRSRAIR